MLTHKYWRTHNIAKRLMGDGSRKTMEKKICKREDCHVHWGATCSTGELDQSTCKEMMHGWLAEKIRGLESELIEGNGGLGVIQGGLLGGTVKNTGPVGMLGGVVNCFGDGERRFVAVECPKDAKKEKLKLPAITAGLLARFDQ